MLDILAGKRVLCTGGTGSLGNGLAPHLEKCAHVRIFSRDEKKRYDMMQRFPDFEYMLGDMRDLPAVRNAVRGIDYIIHAASLKYVDVSEQQPGVYISTNIVGTQNLIAAVQEERTVTHCVGISSDKACWPIANVYGMTKALLEKLFMEAHKQRPEISCYGVQSNGTGSRSDRSHLDDLLTFSAIGIGADPAWKQTKFTVARYGNVVGTRGSVVPFWAELRKKGEPLPVTDPYMTRFFFTLDEAIELIDFAFHTPSGRIVSKAMRSCTLQQLALAMQTKGLRAIPKRPGERIHEALLSSDDMARTINVGGYLDYGPVQPGEVDLATVPSVAVATHFVFNPFAEAKIGIHPAYTSETAERLTKDELRELLKEWL